MLKDTLFLNPGCLPLICEVLLLSPFVPMCWPAHQTDAFTAGPQLSLWPVSIIYSRHLHSNNSPHGWKYQEVIPLRSNQPSQFWGLSDICACLVLEEQGENAMVESGPVMFPCGLRGQGIAESPGLPLLRREGGGTALNQHCLVKQP